MADHGIFCWNELITPNVEVAKRFYTAHFGWTYQANLMPTGGTYWVAFLDNAPCAGIMDMADTPLPAGTPPFWFPYILAKSVDRTADDVIAAQGKLMRPLWDVAGVGRFGIFQDATGAGFGAMTPVPRS